MSGPDAESARSLPPLAALKPGDAFPPLEAVWPADSLSPGLLAVGGALDAATLRRAYAAAIFPWFAPGEPLLWWSPQPRMALAVERFRLHRSLKQALKRFLAAPACEVRFDNPGHHPQERALANPGPREDLNPLPRPEGQHPIDDAHPHGQGTLHHLTPGGHRQGWRW